MLCIHNEEESPLNPPILGDFKFRFPQTWGLNVVYTKVFESPLNPCQVFYLGRPQDRTGSPILGDFELRFPPNLAGALVRS
jgi:hypothetical protein